MRPLLVPLVALALLLEPTLGARKKRPSIPALFDHTFVAVNASHYLVFGGKTAADPNTSFVDSFYAPPPFEPASSLILNATDTFKWANASLQSSLAGATAHAVSNDTVMILYGTMDASRSFDPSDASDSIQLYNHVTGSVWSLDVDRDDDAPSQRHHHLSFFNSSSSRLFVLGGILSSGGARLQSSLGQIWTGDPNLYYLDLKISTSSTTNTTRLRTRSSWTMIPPPLEPELTQAGLAAASGVMVRNYILYCFGSSMYIPTDKCTLFDTDTMEYVLPIYADFENLPAAREGARMIYLEESDQVVLFGGMNLAEDSFMNDIWILNATAIPEIQWRRNGSFKFDITSTLSADESEFTTSLEDFDFDPASERANISSGRDVLPRSLFGASLLQGNKILIFGGIGPVGSEITSNITVLDTQDWSWKPFFWEPRDGLSNSGIAPVTYIAYTTIAIGMAFLVGFVVVAGTMFWKGVPRRHPLPARFSSSNRPPTKTDDFDPKRNKVSQDKQTEMRDLIGMPSLARQESTKDSGTHVETMYSRNSMCDARIVGMFEEEEQCNDPDLTALRAVVSVGDVFVPTTGQQQQVTAGNLHGPHIASQNFDTLESYPQHRQHFRGRFLVIPSTHSVEAPAPECGGDISPTTRVGRFELEKSSYSSSPSSSSFQEERPLSISDDDLGYSSLSRSANRK